MEPIKIKQLNFKVSIWGICKRCYQPVSAVVDLEEFESMDQVHQAMRAEEILIKLHECEEE